MKVAFITDWVQLSPFSELSWFLVEEVYKLGNETFIIAPEFSEKKPQIIGRKDGVSVQRVTPETSAEEVLKQLADWQIDVLLVHAECFEDKQKLSLIVQEFTKGARRSFLFLHNDKYSADVKYALYTRILLPNRFFSLLPPGNTRVSYLELGVPELEFKGGEKEEVEFRQRMVLPTHQPEDTEMLEGYYLATLDGKTNIKDLISSIDYINQYKLVDKPIHLFVHVANQARQGYFNEIESDYLMTSFGYLATEALAAYFHNADGAIFIYPEEKYNATSSAIRFAIGSGAPVIANRGKHTVGVEDGVVTWCSDAHKRSIIHGVVSHFTNVPFRKKNGERIRKAFVARSGWSVIASQLDALLKNKPVRP